jgi:uncharacterized coiled-coil protein SlyX
MPMVVPEVVTGHAHDPPRSIDLPARPGRGSVAAFHPTPMADRFLTISEAEKFTGKSRSTLRRFIDGIVKVENAPDRHLVLPAAEEASALKKQNQPFAWKISEELLRRQFLKTEPEATPEAGKGSGDAPASDSSRLVTVLEKSIAILERELAEKNSQIAAMNDRLRESNILMKDLQDRLALPAPKPAATQAVGEADAKPPKESHAQKGRASAKKRPFSWLFGG